MTYKRSKRIYSYAWSSPASTNGVFYLEGCGFYEFASADVTLSQASLTQTFATANQAHASHPFAVFAGNGTVDTGQVGLRVSGTKIDDSGTRTPTATSVITDDITDPSLNDYLEAEKFIGIVTFELYVVSGSPTTYSVDFNYGLAAYADAGNRPFVLREFEMNGRADGNDTGFNIEVLKHSTVGWTYAATGFVPGDGVIANMNTDYATEKNLVNNEPFRYKRTNLNETIRGDLNEGYLIRLTTTTNGVILTSVASVCVEYLPISGT